MLGVEALLRSQAEGGSVLIEDLVEVTGRLPYSEAVARMTDADVLLACLPPLPGSELKNPAKTAEYVRAGRSILAVCPEGELTRIIDRLGAGYTASPDSEDVLAALETVWSDWREGRLRRARAEDADGIFDMKRNCERLAEFLGGFMDHR